MSEANQMLPEEVMTAVSKVIAFGCEKHKGPDSWRNYTDPHYWNAKIRRHALQIQEGRHNDAESTLPHFAHIIVDAAYGLYAQINATKPPTPL